MARVLALTDDLLFGSRLKAGLEAAGHQVSLTRQVEEADLLIVDLTVDAGARVAASRTAPMPKLGFYSHVETGVRELAQGAGFDLVVPRSRMAREAAALVENLLAAHQ